MLKRELTFLIALWKANLQAALEYRVSFISQVIGMMLNNGIYFLFWVLFFGRFKEVRGWELNDMFVLFGLVATGFGLAHYFFGNVSMVAETIAGGRLDYYLSLPRPVLLHLLASRSQVSAMGDTLYGLLSFLVSGQITPDSLLRFFLGVLLSGTILLSFLVLVQSLAFWSGNSQMLSNNAQIAMVTFSIYPINLFDGPAKILLFTLLPAALVGALPAELTTQFTWPRLAVLLGGAILFLGLAITVFYRGLRRYESGSAIQTQI